MPRWEAGDLAMVNTEHVGKRIADRMRQWGEVTPNAFREEGEKHADFVGDYEGDRGCID